MAGFEYFFVFEENKSRSNPYYVNNIKCILVSKVTIHASAIISLVKIFINLLNNLNLLTP